MRSSPASENYHSSSAEQSSYNQRKPPPYNLKERLNARCMDLVQHPFQHSSRGHWTTLWTEPLSELVSQPQRQPLSQWNPYAESLLGFLRRWIQCPLAWGCTLWQLSTATFCFWPRYNLEPATSKLDSGRALHIYRRILLGHTTSTLHKSLIICLIAIGLILAALYVLLGTVLWLITLVLSAWILGSFLYNTIFQLYFWCFSIRCRFLQFNQLVQRSSLPSVLGHSITQHTVSFVPQQPILEKENASSQDESHDKGFNPRSCTTKEYEIDEGCLRYFQYDNGLLDKALDYLIWILNYMSYIDVTSNLMWNYADPQQLVHDFRHFLFDHPPAWPVASRDHPFLQDTLQNPCQIVMLAVMERIELEEVRWLFHKRWIEKQPKLRSVLARKWGCLCWDPLPFVETSKADITFQAENHIHDFILDLKQVSIYEALSELASTCLPRNAPLWRCVLFQPVNEDVSVGISPHDNAKEVNSSDDLTCTVLPDLDTAHKLSFLVLQVHHSIGDGGGIAGSLLRDLFDSRRKAHVALEKNVNLFTTFESPQAFLWHRFQNARPALKGQSSQQDVALTEAISDHSWLREKAYFAFRFLYAYIYALRVVFFWAVWSPRPPGLLQIVSKDSKELRHRPTPLGRKYLAPPVIVDLTEARRLCSLVHKIIGVKPTLNDIFAYCISVACQRLRQGAVVDEICENLSGRNRSHILKEPINSLYWRDSRLSKSSKAAFIDSHKLPQIVHRNGRPKQPYSQLVYNCYFHRFAIDFEHYLPLLIPISTRTTWERSLDNSIAFVCLRLPLPQATEQQLVRESRCNAFVERLSTRFLSWAEKAHILNSHRRRQAKKYKNSRFETLRDSNILDRKLRHLVAVKGELDWLKMQEAHIQYFTVSCVLFKVLPDFITRTLYRFINSSLQLYFTNVPGPKQICWFGGRRILSLQSWAPVMGEVTTAMKLLTYCGRVQILVSVDEAELCGPFNEQQTKLLCRRDLLTVAAMIGELVKEEYQQLLKDVTEANVTLC